MTKRATMPCDGCSATGIIKRELRKLEDGKPDPLDFRHEELCLMCGGEGVVINWGGSRPPTNDRKPGFVADQIHGSFHDTLHETAFAAGAYC